MSEQSSESVVPVAAELRHALDGMLAAIQAIARGDDAQLQTEFPISHPVGALAAALQEVSESLQVSRDERRDRETKLNQRIEVIEQQRQLIADLSTPVIEVWKGVLALPLIGVFDTDRAMRMTSQLLNSVMELRASVVVLDVTGIEMVDTSIADHFLRMARTVRLLGADCVLSGVRPAMAQTIVSMGLEVGEIRSFPNLGAALRDVTTAALTQQRNPSAKR